MRHPLEEQIAELRRGARGLAVVRALSLAAAASILATFAFGTFDYLARFEDRGWRLLVSGGVLAVVGWAVCRLLVPALTNRLSAVSLGQHVERRFPALSNRLVNAIDMLKEEGDERLGSPTLRGAFIADTTNRAEDCDFRQVLDWRPAVRAVCLCGAVLMAVLLALLCWPSVTLTALARTSNPWSSASWPRSSHLSIPRPVHQIGRGQTFEIAVVDAFGATLPDDLRIHYREDGGGRVGETVSLRRLGPTAIARRKSVQNDFFYRVEGGDDRSMPWTEVAVVEPPAIEHLAIEVVPPSWYGGASAADARDLRVPLGSSIGFRGRATRPLRSVELCVSNGTRIAGRILDDGCTFVVGEPSPLLVEQPGSYWFELVDRDGVAGGMENRWEIVPVPNVEPRVRLHRPSSDMVATPRAIITVSATASDDRALREVQLDVSEELHGKQHRLPLFAGPSRPPAIEPDAHDVRDLNFRWSLQALNLKPGTQVSYHLTASDYASATGDSDRRQLTIVTSAQFRDHVAKVQTLIRSDLETIAERQQRLRQQVELMMARSEGKNGWTAWVGPLQAVSHGQNEIEKSLFDPGQSLPRRLQTLQEELESNPAEAATARRQIAELSVELGELRRDQLGMLRQELGATIKNLELAAKKAGRGDNARQLGESAESLRRITDHQGAVVQVLRRWITVLSWSDDLRSAQKLFAQMLANQQTINQRTVELARRTLGRDPANVSAEDAEALVNRARDQVEMASTMEDFLARMDRIVHSRNGDNEKQAAVVHRALDVARGPGLANQMRFVSRQIARNQVGQAIAGQKDLFEKMHSIARLLIGEDHGKNDASDASREGTAEAAVGSQRQESDRKDRGENPAATAEKPGASPGAAVEIQPTPEVAQPDPARTRARMERLWGQLPERVRQELMPGSIEEFPPQDAALIEEYFRRLAEEPKPERSRP